MWGRQRMLVLRRHAARSLAARPLSDGSPHGASRPSSRWLGLAVGSAAMLSLSLAAASKDSDVAWMESTTGRGSPVHRMPPGPLSKEHLRLARRFTRRNQQKYHKYVIIGSGTAAHAAIEAIRQAESDADILIVSDERALPRLESNSPTAGAADRTSEHEPLSDALLEIYNEWRRHIAQRIEEEDPGDDNNNPVTLLMNKHTKMHFDVEKKRIVLSDGTEIRYEKCLIACSGKPRHFYVLDSDRISYALKDRINTCTTLHDFEQLSGLGKRSDVRRVTVVGGGFLGTEVATAIATDPRNAHLKTQLIFVESAPESRSLPSYLAKELARKLEGVGIEVIPDRLVTSVKCEGESVDQDGVTITALGNGKHKLVSDYVVLASTHTEPNLRFDRQTCFEIDDRNGGIVVNAQLEAMAGVFVAGNAASYYDPYIGRRRVDRLRSCRQQWLDCWSQYGGFGFSTRNDVTNEAIPSPTDVPQ
ncbi:hypothetical protein PINS_up003389 [Pythium insidiosum]|nr:hypothetical protein PINS_up003389 [Pythium insidiosum]